MINAILTPKKQQIHVPGHGVVQKEDFTQDHAKILLKRAERSGGGQKAFIAQHFNVSVGDLPLFKEEENEAQAQEPVKSKKTKAVKVAEPTKTDDEFLEELIKKEDLEKKSGEAEE